MPSKKESGLQSCPEEYCCISHQACNATSECCQIRLPQGGRKERGEGASVAITIKDLMFLQPAGSCMRRGEDTASVVDLWICCVGSTSGGKEPEACDTTLAVIADQEPGFSSGSSTFLCCVDFFASLTVSVGPVWAWPVTLEHRSTPHTLVIWLKLAPQRQPLLTYASEPQQRVRDFCSSLSELSEL